LNGGADTCGNENSSGEKSGKSGGDLVLDIYVGHFFVPFQIWAFETCCLRRYKQHCIACASFYKSLYFSILELFGSLLFLHARCFMGIFANCWFGFIASKQAGASSNAQWRIVAVSV
tara:strand:+ start:704 stop:1054 length:351 start_codon:yes stop_codon:yes gene_type:complete